MKIAVAGTGYVGLSIATLLSQHHEVMAVDIIPEKSFNIMISTTKLSARTVLRAVKAAFRLYQSKTSQGKQAPCCNPGRKDYIQKHS